MIRKPHSPLTQVIRRVSEVHNQKHSVEVKWPKTQVNIEHRNGPVPDLFEGDVLQFRELVMNGVHIRITEGDNCVRINQIVALVENIIIKTRSTSSTVNLQRWGHFFITQLILKK